MRSFEHRRKRQLLPYITSQAISLLNYLKNLMPDSLYPEGLRYFKVVKETERDFDICEKKRLVSVLERT
jgi:hypothetical protein